MIERKQHETQNSEFINLGESQFSPLKNGNCNSGPANTVNMPCVAVVSRVLETLPVRGILGSEQSTAPVACLWRLPQPA